MTVLEQFLDKCSARWVYTENEVGKGPPGVHVDITKFPPGTEDLIQEVGREFQTGLDRFHGRGAEPPQLPVPEAVEGSVNSGAL
jgi:hypothetical protein